MTQTILMKNLAKFIEFTYPKEGKNLKAKLEEKDEGLCFSLAVCDAVMDLAEVDQLAWWEAILVAISTWDGTPDSLDKFIDIPGNAPLRLRIAFEKAINNIIPNQVLDVENFDIDDLKQLNLLDPNGYFIFVDRENKVRKIKYRDSFSGNFTDQQLSELLYPEDLTNNICLLHSISHSVRINYKNNKWIIYNANYDHTNKQKILYKEFSVKDDFVKEIRYCFNLTGCANELIIDIASIKEAQQPFLAAAKYKDMLQKHAPQLLSGYGLMLMIQASPNYLLQLWHTNPEFIKSSTIDINLKSGHDYTALHYAVSNGYEKVVSQLLTRKDIKINLQSKNTFTVLHSAAFNGHTEIVKQLLAYEGIMVDALDRQKFTPLLLAIQKGHFDIVVLLLNHHASIRTSCVAATCVLLDVANKKGRKQEVENFLKDEKGDIKQYIEGFSALHLAVFFGHANIVSLLLERGVNVNKKMLGKHAIDIAHAMGYQEIEEMIMKAVEVKKSLHVPAIWKNVSPEKWKENALKTGILEYRNHGDSIIRWLYVGKKNNQGLYYVRYFCFQHVRHAFAEKCEKTDDDFGNFMDDLKAAGFKEGDERGYYSSDINRIKMLLKIIGDYAPLNDIKNQIDPWLEASCFSYDEVVNRPTKEACDTQIKDTSQSVTTEISSNCEGTNLEVNKDIDNNSITPLVHNVTSNKSILFNRNHRYSVEGDTSRSAHDAQRVFGANDGIS